MTTVCLPYGVIVVHVPTSVSTVRERVGETESFLRYARRINCNEQH